MKATGQFPMTAALRVREMGTIVTDERMPLHERLADLWTDARARVSEALEGTSDEAPVVAVVEMPGTGVHRAQNITLVPLYGAAVGVVVAAVKARAALFRNCFWPGASEWTRGRWLPRTKHDAHKEGRVAFAAELYGIEPERMGPKTTAGNIADALLLALWASNRVALPRCRVIAFDPSIRCTGYAVVDCGAPL